MSNNLMQKAHAAPRCKANSKRSGQPCRAPAVKGSIPCIETGDNSRLDPGTLPSSSTPTLKTVATLRAGNTGA
jgi:hypothetical protein